MLVMRDEEGRDEKILAVPVDKHHPFYNELHLLVSGTATPFGYSPPDIVKRTLSLAGLAVNTI
mgnify:FL=1